MQKKLAAVWGFDFPDDLFDVWKVVRAIDRKHPCDALLDAIGVRLEGPFRVLAGGKVERDLGRWTSDPPEFFTIAAGDTDGLHWGYVVHEPKKSPPVCAHFYARDSPEISIDETLYASLHGWLRDVRRERKEELDESTAIGEPDEDVAKSIAELDRAIALFDEHAPKKRPPAKLPKGVATALDTLDVVCSKKSYERPYTLERRKLIDELRDAKKRAKHVARAQEMMGRGKFGGALHIARDLYFALPEKEQPIGAGLLRDVYAALGRPVLARALEHIAPPKGGPKPKPKRLHCNTLEEALGDLGAVESLAITYHSASRKTPSTREFRAMKTLRHLTLRGCTVKELAIEKAPLESLEIFECKLPSFPRAIAKLKKLDVLTLKGLKKQIPKDLTLPNLKRLEIADAQLTSVPSFVFRAKKLYNLALYYNRIAEVPDDIAKLTSLSYLNVSNNRIEELPDIFDRLPRLSSLWLSNNRLRTLPDSIGKLRGKLKTLDLGKNPLAKDAAERARIKKLLPKTKIYWT